MSAVNALDRLQTYTKAHPTLALERSASVLRAGPVSACAFDYDQAIAIIRQCPAIVSINEGPRLTRLRDILSTLILHIGPSWKWLVPLGRGYLAGHLSPDAKQVFDAAGLYGPSDDPSIRTWWDGLAQIIRGVTANSKMDLGRRGEELSVEYEMRVLAEADRADLYPEAVGFEDNTLGYDVRSFTVTSSSVQAKYIEVKTTESRPLRFYLSRSEWRAAERYGSNYFLHLWHLPNKQVVEISCGELSRHVPIDRGRGNWEKVIVCWE
jgi:hypothetical protein